MHRTEEYGQAVEALRRVGYWPTKAGTEVMQDPHEQARCKIEIVGSLDRLEPAALLALTALVTSLAG